LGAVAQDLSISGLHVTLVSGLVAWLVATLWRRVPALTLRLPALSITTCLWNPQEAANAGGGVSAK